MALVERLGGGGCLGGDCGMAGAGTASGESGTEMGGVSLVEDGEVSSNGMTGGLTVISSGGSLLTGVFR